MYDLATLLKTRMLIEVLKRQQAVLESLSDSKELTEAAALLSTLEDIYKEMPEPEQLPSIQWHFEENKKLAGISIS
ncbi:hypothetical protein [Pseudomonas mosselii]|uniref:Uncharacterized protein n=1 Tax=Pseudomonas mosselii TaxID=78327 RepID=A0A7W2Q121_9PSED|nr:hypothetical protein [Pseudomonas mosselii]MBA6068120.1 hypothetical protein [Pseudomonas mosselii]